MNITANLMGLGNAATPSGIQAMKLLQQANPDKKTASQNMILFVVMNTAAIQLIPTTIAVLRSCLLYTSIPVEQFLFSTDKPTSLFLWS